MFVLGTFLMHGENPSSYLYTNYESTEERKNIEGINMAVLGESYN